jgi:hypothetical protein
MSSRNRLLRNSVLFLSLFFALAALVALQFQLTQATPNAAGDLDTTFGTNGVTITHINGNDTPNGMALRADGKFFVIAEADFTSSSQSVMLLYKTDGTLDASFGSSGVQVLTPFNAGFAGQATAVALQSDGKACRRRVFEHRWQQKLCRDPLPQRRQPGHRVWRQRRGHDASQPDV